MSVNGPWRRVGVGTTDGAVLAFFVPTMRASSITVSPGCGPHVLRAVGWAMTALGRGFHGGRVTLIGDHPANPWQECLCVVAAVDDAVAGGHRTGGLGGAVGTGLVERVLLAPRYLASAAGLDLATL